MPKILLFEDKLGITAGYESIWRNLLVKAGLIGVDVIHRNAHTALGKRHQLLVRKGNRKAPGFNPDPRVINAVATWAGSQIALTKPDLCLCMDPALLFMANPDWDQATLDNLRGGVYKVDGIPFIIMLGIAAWHNKKREKDIAKLNDGYTDREEWEEEHRSESESGDESGDEGDDEERHEEVGHVWLEPVSIPYGKFVLLKDLEKANRILRSG